MATKQRGGHGLDDTDAPWIIVCESEEEANALLWDRAAMKRMRAYVEQLGHLDIDWRQDEIVCEALTRHRRRGTQATQEDPTP
jgi:hypothetical protein